jgi:ATP-binding cassette subfamily C protein
MAGFLDRFRKQSNRVKTPTVLQMEAVECGAAALGIILGYYKKFVPLEELRVSCGVSRDGSKASNVVKAARGYGMVAKGFRRDLDTIQQTPLPAIVFWNFKHFLVVEGFAPGKVFLNDPAEGPRVVTEEEFDEGFTGVVLEISPGEEFEPGGERPDLIATLRDRVRGSEKAILFALLAGVALIVPGILLPAFVQIFVDKILVQNLQLWYRPLMLGLGLTFLVRAGVGYLQRTILLRLKTKISVSTSSGFLWHVLRLPAEFYSQRYGGEISARVGLNDAVASFLSGRLAQAGLDALLVAFYFILMLAYDWMLAMVALVSVALISAATVLVSRRRVDANRRLLQEQGKALGTIMGGLATIETVKASGGENDVFSRWAGYDAKLLNAKQELGVVTQIFLTVPPTLTVLANVTVLALGASRVIHGDLTMGMLVAFQTLLASFMTPVNSFVSLAGTLQEMEGNISRIDDVLLSPIDPQTEEVGDGTEPTISPSGEEPGKSKSSPKLTGDLQLKSVSFGYSPLEPPLIEEFSVTLAPGARIALVGPSGCGKSTVAKLVAGLNGAWSGEILLDGEPRNQISRRVLANSLAVVDQEVTLFEGSIRENLTLWDSTVPDSALIRACKDACIHDEIVARPGGYDDRVEEGGGNFSGGQCQRMEIARALVTDPRLLIMDEATSALDSVTEEIIDGNLRRRGCTCVIIAHRLSTIRDADEIIVLEKGKVLQRGTHEELLQDGEGLYATLTREA